MDHQESRKLTRSQTFQQCKTDGFTFTGNQHPLLNPLIVKHILEFCKVNNQDIVFPSLRLVCKLWDEECTKVLRRETQIPIPRLLEPYPDGLGWTSSRLNLTTGLRHHYKCPLPTTRQFENLHITATCESFKNTRIRRWFSCMGYQVKSLHFTSALTCFHHNDFLADVLYKWCPNLETLHLDGIQCFQSLIFMFEGKLNEFSSFKNCTIICKKLKTLIISVENDSDFKDCKSKVGRVPGSASSSNKETMKNILNDVKKIIAHMPEKDFSLPLQINRLFYQFVENEDPEFYSQLLNEYPKMNGVDWGVLGHILKTAPLQKIVIKNLLNKSQTEDLILFLVCQPSKIRSTLEHLEFQNATLCLCSLRTLSLLRCPLYTLCIDKILWRSGSASSLNDILRICAPTLINFEVGVEIVIYGVNIPESQYYLQLPVLPKLKSFTNKTIGLLHFCGWDLLTCAPNLKKLCIQNLRCDGSSASEKDLTNNALNKLCWSLNDFSRKEHSLKDLKIAADIEGTHLYLLKMGLPNLVNVALNIVDPLHFLLAYPKCVRWENLESAAFSFGDTGAIDDIVKFCNRNEANSFGSFESLKFFDLTFTPSGMTNLPLRAFTNGFSKLLKLRSLKVANFSILADENEDIEKSVERIPFVSFTNETVISREEFIKMTTKTT